jgi:peptide/nickel transport system permease protein
MSTMETTPIPRAPETPFRRFWSEFCESPTAVFGLVVTTLLLLAAIFAPWISPQNPYDLMQVDFMDSELPPGALGGMGQTYLLGTDANGRDMLSALLYGLRSSFLVAVSSLCFALVIGVLMGLVSAYVGGRVDAFIMRVVDVQMSFPTILIALMLLVIFGRGLDKTILALTLVQWAYFARNVRASALGERTREYVLAAQLAQIPTFRILWRHILPNCLPPLMVIASVQLASAISIESSLSFLGLGLPVTQPSLGSLISNGFAYLMGGKYWISVFPGVALVLVVFSINLVSDRLRDMFNPRLTR